MTDNLFDLSAEYDELLDRGLRLSGENKYFFIDGRIRDLTGHLPDGWTPRRIYSTLALTRCAVLVASSCWSGQIASRPPCRTICSTGRLDAHADRVDMPGH